MADSKLGSSSDNSCVLKAQWHRFLETFMAHCSLELEDAVRRARGNELPKIVLVPTEAEDLAKCLE